MASIPLKIQCKLLLTIDRIAETERLLRFRNPRALEGLQQGVGLANREDLVEYIEILQDRDIVVEQSR